MSTLIRHDALVELTDALLTGGITQELFASTIKEFTIDPADWEILGNALVLWDSLSGVKRAMTGLVIYRVFWTAPDREGFTDCLCSPVEDHPEETAAETVILTTPGDIEITNVVRFPDDN
jgi:hypothetical protein